MADTAVELLCTGDLHLGRHPTRIPAALDSDAFSPRSVWRDVVAHAIDAAVDAVVLTGDVADRENRYFEAYGAFETGIHDLADAGIPVVAVAGNHDAEFLPRMVEDVDSDALHLLGAGGTWERWTLDADGDGGANTDGAPAVHLDGWSFPRSHVPSSPLDDYDPAALDARTDADDADHADDADDAPVIGVLHADLDAPQSDYAPITSSELRNTPAAGWLLGHIHVPGTRIDADPLTLYPGSPQPLDPGERGTHGPWLVTVTPDGAVDADQVPLATLCYDEIAVDAADAADTQDVVPAVTDAIDEYVEEQLRTHTTEAFLPRIRLTGRSPAHAALVEGTDDLAAQLELRRESVDVRVESVGVDTRPDVDLEERAAEEGPVAYLAELLLALRDGEPRDPHEAMIDEAHGAMRDAHSANTYNPLRRERGVERPDREHATEVLEQEARTLLDTLVRQKEDRA